MRRDTNEPEALENNKREEKEKEILFAKEREESKGGAGE